MLIRELFSRKAAFTGRRTFRRGKRINYHFDPRYVAITPAQTPRKCYIHPQEQATHWELNTQDKSYKRPVCVGCSGE